MNSPKQLNIEDDDEFEKMLSDKLDSTKHKIMQYIWWNRTYSTHYYNIKYGISNLFKWFNVVWRDRDYDSDYILSALLFKIKNTRKLTQRNRRCTSWDEDVFNMLRCETILERLIEDDYATECGYNSDRSEIAFIPINKNSDEDEDDYGGEDEQLFEMKNIHKNPQTDEELNEIFKNARILADAEKTELFDILNKHILSWWD